MGMPRDMRSIPSAALMSPSATDVLQPFQALVSMWSIDPINTVNSALGNL